VLKRAVAALDARLIPIVCVRERENKTMEEALTKQFRYGIGGLSDEQFARIVIA
jgi:triosephosphate isomerase